MCSCQRPGHLGTLAGVFVGLSSIQSLGTGVHSAFQSVDSWPAVLSYGPKADPVLRVATPSRLLHLQVGSTLVRQLPAVCS